ncbi:Olfactory receptor 6C74 [Varanus komodoensis]|nr:Olfactory receptor 6C74 [Varanus komodoensis]
MMNRTTVSEFLLLGFTSNRQLEVLLASLLASTYLLTITGNAVIITITLVNHQLCTPMYFFLRHFAILEIGFTMTIIPKALTNMFSGDGTISLPGCFLQVYLYLSLGLTEFLLLAIMSIDRYVAICNPLHYTSIMTGPTCSLLVLCSWMAGFLLILGPAIALLGLPFCGPRAMDHFFCDIGSLIKRSCMDTSLLEFMVFLLATLSLLGTLTVNLVSYANIISTIMCIPSTEGRQKAFSTCISQITVVSLTYGSCIFMYIKPSYAMELSSRKRVSILNTVVAPLLNPFIYCLRNKQVQDALKAAFNDVTDCLRNQNE